MSSLSISFGYVRCSKSLGVCEGARGTQRVSMQGACGPPYQSSAAARAPGPEGRGGPAVPELGSGERSVLVEHVAHEAEVLDVVVVPEARRHAVRVVRFGMDRAVLRADRGVAALGLHRTEVRLVERLLRPEPIAVRDLVEAVLHCLRPDLDRLEEDVVLRVTRHSVRPPLDALGKRFSNRSPLVASSRQNEGATGAAPSNVGCEIKGSRPGLRPSRRTPRPASPA